jgi:hypothetical protein
MEELRVDFSEFYPNLIYLEFNFFQDEYTFIKNRNFKKETIKTTFQRYYISLIDNLDLKYFKIEIPE